MTHRLTDPKNKIVALLLALLFCFCVRIAAQADTTPPTQADLEQQLAVIEQQIAADEAQLQSTTSEKKSLQAAIQRLRGEQHALKLQLAAVSLQLTMVQQQLATTKSSIDQTKQRIMLLHEQIASALQELNGHDHELLIESLSSGSLGDTFVLLTNYGKLASGLSELASTAKQEQLKLEDEQVHYQNEQDQTAALLSLKQLQQHKLTDSLTEQNNLLVITKGKESTYQQLISNNKQRAQEIRTRLYELFGTTNQITFGEAVHIADWVSGQTGVRTPFLLAILTQESNLGKNVGTCNRPGDPSEKGWRVIMKPDRDQEPFKTITSELGKDPDVTPVSCPMHNRDGSQLGWGGAMGPAQFIPSTWLAYRSQVAAITGKSTANPWDIRDAFIAAALKVRADGADGTTNGEWKAAMRYFSGSTNTAYRFYGDNVIRLAQKYESDIATLNN